MFNIHIFVYRNIIPNYSQQDATFLDLLIFTNALHVSGGSFAHHQEHTTVQTASGIVNNTAASCYHGVDGTNELCSFVQSTPW
jgi:hypothetical protein